MSQRSSLSLLVLLAACAGHGFEAQPPPNTVAPIPALVPKAASSSRPNRLPYPPTRRDDVADVLHGVEVHDPYRWLEDGNSNEVQRWMSEQDSLARAELAKIPLLEPLKARLESIAHQEESWAPVPRGRRLFYQRRDIDRQRPVVYWRDGNGPEHVLLDPDAWAADRSLSLGDWWPSWDGKKVAYQEMHRNSDAARLRIIDVATGKISDVDVIEGGEWPILAWTPSSDAFYYQWIPTDPTVRATRYSLAEGRLHRVGDDPVHDVVVRKLVPGQTGCPLVLDSQGRWLVSIVTRGWARSDVYFEDLREPHPRWRTLVAGRDGEFWVEAHRGMFYVSSTDGAPRGEVFAVDPRHPSRADWERLVPERPDATLRGLAVVGNRLVIDYFKDVVVHREIHALDGTLVRAVPPRIGTLGWLQGTPDGGDAYYAFESYDQPPEIRRVSMRDGTESVWRKHEVDADFSQLVVEQVFYRSKDGTRIPMFIFHRKDVKRDGSAPLLLWGYGASNVVPLPNFSPLIIPWVERGGVYAYGSLRGGGEYGEEWHRAGSGRNKQNTFDDYIAGAEYLIHEGWTSADRLAARGASWGGLLVTAALTQRPDLFRAVLAVVPQTDMIRFPLTGLGRAQIAEFGDPANPDDFRALFAYSPYHHVVPGTRYPAVLIRAAEDDERVDPLHARKFAAALQAASTGGPVLMRVDWGTGHKGTGIATDEAENRAEEYAFALDAMGLGGR